MSEERGRVPAWSWIALVAILLFDLWLRLYTVSPAIKQAYGVNLWPTVKGESEPLDCDEAVYAYMGKRMVAGDVLYRDLTENKPPLGYWIYGLAVKLGGPTEWTIRLMPLPMVLATIGLVWWIGLKLRGPLAANVSAFAFSLLSTDPYLFGNGANLEHMMNLFGIASLAAVVHATGSAGSWRSWLLAGVMVGSASLVKQTSAIFLPLYGAMCLIDGQRPVKSRLIHITALGAGFASCWVAAMVVLLMQGALADGLRDFVGYGLALARETPPEPGQPSRLVRWITGNADPRGVLPLPFGKTDYLVWWGTGSWPLWLMAVPGLVAMLAARDERKGTARLVALWSLAAWVEVGGSGLFWQHYYLLPTPGIALVVGYVAAACRDQIRTSEPDRKWTGPLAGVGLVGVVLAIGGTMLLQARDYLGVSPEEVTSRYKGGRQWVTLRDLGREIGRRSRVFEQPGLYVWGWQSPLYFYSGLDGVTRQNFVDPLMKAFAPMDPSRMPPAVAAEIVPRIERTTRDLLRERPPLIFVADRPFPALRKLLEEQYLPSRLVPATPEGQGLWVRRDFYGAFETFELRASIEPDQAQAIWPGRTVSMTRE